MTITYKNARQAVGTSYTTIYTCPSATTALVVAAQFANIHATNVGQASLQWLDSSASNAATRLVPATPVDIQSALGGLTGPITLEAGDALQAKADATSTLELSVTVAEIS